MTDRVFIIHGWKAVPVEGWRPWLKMELESAGSLAIIPEMPNAADPDPDAWAAHLAHEVLHPDEHTHFIGHSLGCSTILRYIESLPDGVQVGKVVFVAGFATDIGIKEIKAFTAKPFDFHKIRSKCADITCIYSDNDEYVPTAQADLFAEKLDAKLVLIKNGKHFSSSDGYVKLPEALEALTSR
jgi:uncharacterized protein